MRYKIILVSILLLGIAVIILAQFSIPALFGADGYLHIRMAQFIREYGIKYDFHWARYSIFAQAFADKDFLYHVLLIPFTFLPNIFLGAKISACIFTVLLYLIFFFLLRRYCARPLVPVMLLVFLFSAPFLEDISQARNMVLIIALTFLFVHFLIQQNQPALFIITTIYTLAHVSGPYLLVFALLGEGARFSHNRQFNVRSIIAVALGLLLGFLIHPNFPNNFLVFYLNGILVPIYALKWGLELGAEFFPLNTSDFVLNYPFILIGLILLIAASASDVRQIKVSTRIWMSIAGFFFVLSFFSQRYITHGYPLILMSLGAYFSDWLESGARLLLIKQHRILRQALIAGLSLAFVLIGLRTYKQFRARAAAEQFYGQHFQAIANWMAQNIPAGEIIFHSNWSDSQYLIGLNPKDDYFVTLDPIYMYYWNPKKYNLYRDISFGRSSDPYSLLKYEFNVGYGYCGKNYFSGLINQIRPDQRFEVLAEDGLGLIFRLK